MTVQAANPARAAASEALIEAAPQGTPTRPTPVRTAGLEERDARLAEAIYRTAVQRWLTINHLLDACLAKRTIEPRLRAVLAGGAAQLVFMDRLPAHAVVDTTVEQAKAWVRRGAGNLANAVLRKVGEMVVERRPDEPWEASDNCIPWGGGHIKLSRQTMLKPRQPARYLSIATSHHPRLVSAWLERFGRPRAVDLLLHNLQTPPTIVHAPGAERGLPHATPPFRVWDEDHRSLAEFLGRSHDRWVQDPSAFAVVDATRRLADELRGGLIVDFCAGRGTKTRGLAVAHPEARIVATDIHTERLESLKAAGRSMSGVEVVEPARLAGLRGEADLVLLDVPCTNSGVLARRPEARYRFSLRAVDSVVATQRAILADAGELLAAGGRLLYATCSLEPAENDEQVEWAMERFGLELIDGAQRTPSGAGTTYQDGSYFALLRRR